MHILVCHIETHYAFRHCVSCELRPKMNAARKRVRAQLIDSLDAFILSLYSPSLELLFQCSPMHSVKSMATMLQERA